LPECVLCHQICELRSEDHRTVPVVPYDRVQCDVTFGDGGARKAA
jgi:hypothetical protein